MSVLAIAVVTGLVLGGLTALAQGRLPDVLAPVANSSGSWCLTAFALSLAVPSLRWGAVCGFTVLSALLAGYVLTDEARGHSAGTGLILFWGTAALVVGPLLGVAAHWTRAGRPIAAALGLALIGGILVGEGCYGLTFLADTTSSAYWVGSVAAGVVLVASGAVSRLHRADVAAAAFLATGLVAGAFVGAYSVAGRQMGIL